MQDHKLYAVRFTDGDEQGQFVGLGGTVVDNVQDAQLSKGKNLRRKLRDGKYYKEFYSGQEAVPVKVLVDAEDE